MPLALGKRMSGAVSRMGKQMLELCIVSRTLETYAVTSSLRGKDIQGERDVASSRLEILFPHSRLKRTRHGCAGFRPRP